MKKILSALLLCGSAIIYTNLVSMERKTLTITNVEIAELPSKTLKVECYLPGCHPKSMKIPSGESGQVTFSGDMSKPVDKSPILMVSTENDYVPKKIYPKTLLGNIPDRLTFVEGQADSDFEEAIG